MAGGCDDKKYAQDTRPFGQALLDDGLYKSINAGSTWNKVIFIPDNTLPGDNTNPENTSFNGYKLSNIYQVVCDATGDKLIMTTNAAAAIYRSTDGGSTWSFIYAVPGYFTNPQTPTFIASNSDGTILYAALNNITDKKIIVSKGETVIIEGAKNENIYNALIDGLKEQETELEEGEEKIMLCRFLMLIPVENVPYDATIIAFDSFSVILLTSSRSSTPTSP
jgi:hypothetical protein